MIERRKIKEEEMKAGNRLQRILMVMVVVFTVYRLPLTVGPLSADFEDTGFGVRSAGMGNAFVGLADDASALGYNPAGLYQLKYKEFISSFGKLYLGLDDKSDLGSAFIAYAHPTKNFGALATGWKRVSVTNTGRAGYSEDTFIVGYARKFFKQLYWGMGLKLLAKEYSDLSGYLSNSVDGSGLSIPGVKDPVFNSGYTKTGVSLDLGVLYRFGKNYACGLSLTDVNQPNMNLLAKETIPLGVKIGLTHRRENLSLLADLSLRGPDWKVLLGGENWTAGHFALRGGVGLGTRDYANLSLGTSYKYTQLLQLDYAFIYPLSGIRETWGTHRLSLTVRFGAVTRMEEGYIPPAMEKRLLEEQEKMERIKAYKNRAKSLFDLGEYYQASGIYEEILTLDPADDESLKMMKLCQRKIDDKVQPLQTEIMRLSEKGFYQLALDKVVEVIKVDPQNKQMRQMNEKLDQIANVLPKIEVQTKVDELLLKGTLAIIKGNGKLALNSLLYASQLKMGDTMILRLLDIAERYYPGLKEQPIAGMNLVEQKLFVALNYIYEGRYDLAVSQCSEVLELEPDNVLSLKRLGSAYFGLGQKDKANEKWRRALQLDPNDLELRQLLGGEAPVIKKEEKPATQPEVQPPAPSPAGDETKEKIKGLWTEGMEYYNKGDYTQAIEIFKKILEMDPNHAAAKIRIKMAEEALKNK